MTLSGIEVQEIISCVLFGKPWINLTSKEKHRLELFERWVKVNLKNGKLRGGMSLADSIEIYTYVWQSRISTDNAIRVWDGTIDDYLAKKRVR